MLAFGNPAYFVLLVVSDGEESFLQLPVIDLCQKVGLVLYRVRACREPFSSVNPFGLCVVSCGDEVVVVSHLLVEGTELNQPVAHYVGVGREAGLHFLHRVACHLIPVFLMAVDDLQPAAEAAGHGGRHLHVLFRVAVPFLLLFRTDSYIKAVGMQAEPCEFIHHDRTVNTSRKQYGDASVH